MLRETHVSMGPKGHRRWPHKEGTGASPAKVDGGCVSLQCGEPIADILCSDLKAESWAYCFNHIPVLRGMVGGACSKRRVTIGTVGSSRWRRSEGKGR
jgi:hypothetical protein